MPKTGSSYTPDFFAGITNFAADSASVVFDLVFQLYRPSSLLDVGCGIGAWLAEAADRGIDVQGVDGDWVTREQLRIPPDRFRSADVCQPLDLGRRFDMVMSLEVAEHLPAEAAEIFIDTLTRHADVVLFSAAVPEQGGNHHVNEQWPPYWKAKFEARGYELFDVLRTQCWDDERVAWWYRQNVLLYATGESAEKIRAAAPVVRLPLALVHPGKLSTAERTRKQAQKLAAALIHSVKERLRL